MREKQITITQQELDKLVQRELEKRRRILFDICFENYGSNLTFVEKKFLWKHFIIIDKKEWERLWKQFSKVSEDLMDAREILEITEPFYKKYHTLHEPIQKQERPFSSFDEYIQMINTEYTSEEFERAREQFEKEYYNQLDDETER